MINITENSFIQNESYDLNLFQEIEKASKRIEPYIFVTPLVKNNYLSNKINTNIWIKYDNLQETGSFKLRGAANKLILLKEKDINQIVTASSGNHGLAIAYMCNKLNIKGYIFIPMSCDVSKKQKIIDKGGENITLKIVNSKNSGEAERLAQEFSRENNIPYISPYNDLDIIAGQGTIGYEISEELKKNFDFKFFDEIYVSVGGGGLISGISSYILNEDNKTTKFIGVQPVNSAVLYHSIKSDRILDPEKKEVRDDYTISDGTAGGIDFDTITFEICKKNIYAWELLEEEEIEMELFNFIDEEKEIIEGAAALTIAGCVKRFSNSTDENLKNKNICLFFCGKNISKEKLENLQKKFQI